MPALRTLDVKNTVARIAREQLQAAAGNALLSRSEQQALPQDLQAAAQAVRTENGAGARVTVDAALTQLVDTVDAALDAVNQQSGPGRALLSRAEIAALVQQDPAVGARVQSAADVLAAQGTSPAPSAPLSGGELKAALEALLPNMAFDGLLGSEGGEPISAVMVPGPFMRLDRDTFVRALQLDTTTPAGQLERFERPTRQLFTDLVELHQLSAFPAGTGTAAQAVVDLLKGQLRELRLVVVGKDDTALVDPNHPTYIVGLAHDGSLVGLKTGVIWT